LDFRDVFVLPLLLSPELTVLPLVKGRFDSIPREPERGFALRGRKLVLHLGKQERGSEAPLWCRNWTRSVLQLSKQMGR
jgi:hypothetical protein